MSRDILRDLEFVDELVNRLHNGPRILRFAKFSNADMDIPWHEDHIHYLASNFWRK